jgi:hypothetical protein
VCAGVDAKAVKLLWESPRKSQPAAVLEMTECLETFLVQRVPRTAPVWYTVCHTLGKRPTTPLEITNERMIGMKSVLTLMSLMLLATGIASAQLVSAVTFTMDTAFEVGNTTLPSGEYEIAPTDDPSLVELQAVKGPEAVMFEVTELESGVPFNQTEVVFNKYGNNLVLKSIKLEGEDIGATTVTSHLERRHAKSFGKPTKVSRPAKQKG